MKIAIIGGGNIGTQFAVHLSQDNDVTIYTENPSDFIPNIKMINESDNRIMYGKNIKATDNEIDAFKDADIIFVTYPAFLMEEAAHLIYPYVKENLKIGIIPGTGGGECAFKKCVEKGAVVFGLQRVPSVSRLIEKGKCVRVAGYRDELFLGSIPKKEAINISKFIEKSFNIKCTPLDNYLCVTLTPSNPILHTTRLKTIFDDYKDGKTYDYIPLFYEEWSDKSSSLLFKCDEEVQNICKELKDFDLKNVKSLKLHYESNTIEELTNKMRSIESLKGLKTPSIEENGKLKPDLNSRYFTADFPYGLSILIQIGNMLGLDVKNMEETMNWYRGISLNKEEFDYKRYGINNINDFIEFYNK